MEMEQGADCRRAGSTFGLDLWEDELITNLSSQAFPATHSPNESAHEAATPQAHDGIESTGLQPCDTHFVPFLSEESDTYAYHSVALDAALAGRCESTENVGGGGSRG